MFGVSNPDLDRYEDMLDEEYENHEECLCLKNTVIPIVNADCPVHAWDNRLSLEPLEDDDDRWCACGGAYKLDEMDVCGDCL